MALPTRVHRGFVDPFNAVRDIDHALSRWFGGRQMDGNEPSSIGAYGVDVREDADHLYVEADLPGFKKDEVDITLENQILTISAEKKMEVNDQPQGEWLINERRYSRFLRSFNLPATVSDQQVDAKLMDGVLKITLNKREETKPRKIQVG